jgi:Cu+-exporting ATPase
MQDHHNHAHGHDPESGHHGDHGRHDHGAGTVVDPVCGMSVDPRTAKHRADYHGHTYYFCSAGCRERVVAEPE